MDAPGRFSLLFLGNRRAKTQENITQDRHTPRVIALLTSKAESLPATTDQMVLSCQYHS